MVYERGTRSVVSTRWMLVGLVLVGLGLRLWPVRHGLPWVYNVDEERHFVPVAVRMFDGSFNPDYFENPPALTYLLYAVFRLRFPEAGFREVFAAQPTGAYETARVVVAVIGAASVAVVYWAGVRWFDRRVGLLAAALIAVGFLPAFYGKLALNDAVTLAPVAGALGLIAVAWARGRAWRWAAAGAAIGVATAVKYTAGAMLLPLMIAILLRAWEAPDPDGHGEHTRLRTRLRRAALSVLGGGGLAVVAGVVAFLVLNPYSVLDFSTFRAHLLGQSATAGGLAKLGQADTPGWLYYLWTLTWGLGWVPAVAAAAGAVLALRENWRRGLVLVIFPLFMLLFLSGQARYFGRWFMPAYPAIVLLAGYGAVRATDWIRRGRRWTAWALPAVTVLMLTEGSTATIRVNAVLAHTDTRELARDWILRNVPANQRIVVEPFAPKGWLAEPNRAGRKRYRLYPIRPPFQTYEQNLDPSLIDTYRAKGYCWVVVASHQKQRGLQAKLPDAIDYYQLLDHESDRTQRFDPWRPGADPPGFDFDMTFNYYPTAFARPGPFIEVHHLRGCRP